MENFANHFFDIVTTCNDEICYVTHVLAPLYVFFTTFGCWGGGGGGLPRGIGHNLLMHFSRLGSSKMEISETDFLDTLTIQNDQISYLKHVLAPRFVFFTLLGCWGGGPKGSRATCLRSFPASAAQKRLFPTPLRGALPKAIEFVM